MAWSIFSWDYWPSPLGSGNVSLSFLICKMGTKTHRGALAQGGHPAKVCCWQLQAGPRAPPLKAGRREGHGESWKPGCFCEIQTHLKRAPSPEKVLADTGPAWRDFLPALKLGWADEVGVQVTPSMKLNPCLRFGFLVRRYLWIFLISSYLASAPWLFPRG